MRGGIYINNLYYNINTEDEKIKDYIIELVDIIEEYDYLKLIQMPYIWKVYADSIGKEIYCNCKLISDMLKLKENIDSISDELCKDILEDYRRLEVKNRYSEFNGKLNEYENALDSVINYRNINLKGLIDEEKVREIYKKLIFYYHPIIRKDKTKLWKEISKAYMELNLDALEKIYFLGKDFSYSEDKWETTNIEDYKNQLKNNIRKLKGSFPFVLKDEILDDQWRSKIEMNIYENNIAFEKEIKFLEEELKHLEEELKEKKGLS